LKTNAFHRIDELQKNQNENSKTVFVAMSFDPVMKEVRDAICSAIEALKLSPVIMDEIQHNHQIVPEMLYQIRQAKFIIAELTNHNNGAYFEAGYALGCGKEVIQICNKNSFKEDGHFDVKQVNTIMWEDAEQLKEALIKRITATTN
jgi:nucleoside 2-deoxyribosyltransferase